MKQQTVIWRDTTDEGVPLATLDILLTPPTHSILELDGKRWAIVAVPEITILNADPPYSDASATALLIVTRSS